jgi:hypothetical protein
MSTVTLLSPLPPPPQAPTVTMATSGHIRRLRIDEL